jgi:threonyl-tRNA synthetase
MIITASCTQPCFHIHMCFFAITTLQPRITSRSRVRTGVQDAIGRKWQCSTVQLDFNLPERFDIVYHDSDTVRQRPIMLHRAILGSIERFFGILIENYAGAFPAWLAPVQCRLLPVNEACEAYCSELRQRMKDAGIRVDMVRPG